MKKILVSLSIIGVVAALAIGGTVAYFSDTETSTGNTFIAGSIDLKIDLQCEGDCGGFSLRDLDGDSFFNECDIKPGDTGEITVSWHVYNNNAWGRVKLDHVHDYDNGCTEPEGLPEGTDTTCDNPGDGQGELSQYLTFDIWLDEGIIIGWQCPENQPSCQEDPYEGDNIFNGVEVLLADDVTASELSSGWFVLPEEIIGSYTYYLGVQWEINPSVGNIIQTDSFTAWIVMQVVQSRNNSNPWQ